MAEQQPPPPPVNPSKAPAPKPAAAEVTTRNIFDGPPKKKMDPKAYGTAIGFTALIFF